MGEDVTPERQDLQLESLGLVYQRLVRDQTEVVDFAAVSLARVLPGAVNVKRRGLLGRGPVEMVRVTIGDRRYELRLRNGQLEATQCELVGGVALRHDRLTLTDWVASLLGCLDRWAVSSDTARAALEQLR